MAQIKKPARTVPQRDGRADTNSVVGAQRVERVCSAHKQATVLAEQDLDEVTALALLDNETTQEALSEM